MFKHSILKSNENKDRYTDFSHDKNQSEKKLQVCIETGDSDMKEGTFEYQRQDKLKVELMMKHRDSYS